jgi:hypothetical protein
MAGGGHEGHGDRALPARLPAPVDGTVEVNRGSLAERPGSPVSRFTGDVSCGPLRRGNPSGPGK